MGPKVQGNPIRISVYILVISYVVGEFIIPKYPIIYLLNMVGLIGLILSLIFFFSGFNLFKSYKENPIPTSDTKRLIKTGIFAYTRNPIYLALILFLFSMFLVFENIMYLLSSLGLFIWLNMIEDTLYSQTLETY
jgi:protein-S-isoprenylcysteine O-methyltransferase Ste14